VDVPIPDYRAALREDLTGLRIGHVAHFYEQDSASGEEQRAAMQAAVAVLRELGATVEEIGLRPLQTYYDVKIVIAEAELLSVHRDDFVQRPYDFSSDLRRRILPASVFTALDYVSALRLRQQLIDEARPVFARFDALLTLGNGPATRIADHRTVSSWESPKIAAAFNVIGGGAVSLCNGFSRDGLPLSMQIASRPFEDATALAIAHAYERATGWRDRRPALHAATPKPAIVARFADPERPQLDAQTLRIAEVAAQRSGFMMDQTLFIELCEGLPHALAMARRLQASFPRDQEPCLSFRMPR
jgi:aspartyl-tRNA(Asn)/glutamyl-tRNA(Gln) amidotransferase subunit A